MSATRRRVLKIMGAAAAAPLRPGLVLGAAQLLGGCGGSSSEVPVPDPGIDPLGSPLRIPPVLNPSSATAMEDFYVLSVGESEIEILPDKPTHILGFDGMTPGPTIRARAGRPVTVSLLNELPQTTLGDTPGEVVIHLHGGHVPSSEDGYPTDTVQPGTSRTYSYPNNQLPATLWYHDHLMDFTGPHVWFGLAGLYLITDDHEESLGLPNGAYEIPLVIQDRNFDGDGNLVYTGNLNGEVGNTLLVNGTMEPYLRVANRKYRFRMLNGSNVRTYRIALSNGDPFHVLGMEGGLLPSPGHDNLDNDHASRTGRYRDRFFIDSRGGKSGAQKSPGIGRHGGHLAVRCGQDGNG